jgi:Dyp-type peroxidase family
MTATAQTSPTALDHHDLDLHNPDVQGLVRRPYGRKYPAVRLLFLTFAEPVAGRDWLREAIPRVTSGALRQHRPPWALNIAFSAAGLVALGLDDRTVSAFPAPFPEGMASRLDVLGDDPAEWEPEGPGLRTTHAVAVIHAQDAACRDEAEAQLLNLAAPGAVTVTSRQDGDRLAGGAEHFGFADGLSQPRYEANPAEADTEPDDHQPPLPLGELLFGYPDAEGVSPLAELGALTHNGTFLVYRKLQQHVDAYRQLTSSLDERGVDPDDVTARLVGRRPSGDPLAFNVGKNDFDYRGDPDGLRCPVAAHIRRANPRAGGWPVVDAQVDRHRIVRRGVPYGPPVSSQHPDTEDRGLLFLCLGASIGRQFELIQTQWLAKGNSLGLGLSRDPFVGANEDSEPIVLPGAQPIVLPPLPRLVTSRAGEYFFLPSMTGLRLLAGEPGEPGSGGATYQLPANFSRAVTSSTSTRPRRTRRNPASSALARIRLAVGRVVPVRLANSSWVTGMTVPPGAP